jgi:CheY-like chemotaxis protein
MAKICVTLDVFYEPADVMRALKQLNGGFPGLILCDLKLPGMDGLAFLDWLRASPYRLIPVVIRSNSNLQEDVNAAYEHGANCYVQKGFDIATIQKNFKLLLQFWSTMCTPEVQNVFGE